MHRKRCLEVPDELLSMPGTSPLPLGKRLLFSLVVVTTLVSLPEAALRWTNVGRALFPHAFEDPYRKSDWGAWRLLTYDPVLYWRGRPFVRLGRTDEFLNARGFRGSGFRDEKPPGMKRIVCMGDSSTFGIVHHGDLRFTYSPTYSSELETLLNHGKPVQRVQVVNAGVIGYSTLQGLRLLKHEVRHWQPDVITLRYGVNDYLRSSPTYLPALESRSAILRWMEDALLDTATFQLLLRLKAPRPVPPATPVTSSPPSEPVRVRVPLADFEYNLQRLVLEGRATGAKVVLLTAPLAPASPWITANQEALWTMGYVTYEDLITEHQRYEDAVRRVAADLDVALLDTSRRFSPNDLERFFTGYDLAHPNGDGHIAIAHDLAALIASERLLSQ
jgi:lysophospholipase L1-like esterase